MGCVPSVSGLVDLREFRDAEAQGNKSAFERAGARADARLSESVLTIGAYDGVHIGHREIIRQVKEKAEARGVPSVVVTFDRHPAEIVKPELAPLLLSDGEQKLELLACTGVDFAYFVHFDAETASIPAEDFVSDMLVGTLGAKEIVVGHDFHFGKNRSGNVELLKSMGIDLGFSVDDVSLIRSQDAPLDPRSGSPSVSSTSIRWLVADGQVARAASLLGREYQVRGEVVRGDGVGGKDLGCPTANLKTLDRVLLPKDGVYSGFTSVEGETSLQRCPSVISVGRRPTFYDDSVPALVESHLLDRDVDLYGKWVRIDFTAWMRGQMKFGSVEELISQIELDITEAKTSLAHHLG